MEALTVREDLVQKHRHIHAQATTGAGLLRAELNKPVGDRDPEVMRGLSEMLRQASQSLQVLEGALAAIDRASAGQPADPITSADTTGVSPSNDMERRQQLLAQGDQLLQRRAAETSERAGQGAELDSGRAIPYLPPPNR